MGKKVYFLVPYPKGEAPSQRFRFEQYFDLLDQANIQYSISSFYSKKAWKILHYEGNTLKKVWFILLAFGKRFLLLPRLIRVDWVFIHREVSPAGPAIFEWIIAKILRKKIIYDFDDAIWLPNYSEANAKVHRLKFYRKVNGIMRWATKISVGNQFLAEYVHAFNDNTIQNPTTIDTENYHNPNLFGGKKQNPVPVIGWTGTHTTLKYLDFLVPILEDLAQTYTFEFQIISNEKPPYNASFIRFIRWKKETEIFDLMRFDIGVMPLKDDPWSRGKCGFKALQYMSLGIPAIVSPVGVNTDIVDHQINGMIADEPEEWKSALAYFLDNPERARSMQQAARNKIEIAYSVKSNSKNFLQLFD